VTLTANHRSAARTRNQPIVSCVTSKGVSTPIPEHPIRSITATGDIITQAAGDHVITRVTEDRVVAGRPPGSIPKGPLSNRTKGIPGFGLDRDSAVGGE